MSGTLGVGRLLPYDRGMRTLLPVSLVLAILGSSGRAHAETSDALNYIAGSVAIGVPYLTISAVLIGEGLDDAIGRGHGLAEAGAILEIVWAGVHLAAGIGMLIAVSVACSNGCGFDSVSSALLGVGMTLTAVGAAYLAHGIWSLTTGRPPPPVMAAFAPIEGGGFASAQLSF
jgi:hypothetical protein